MSVSEPKTVVTRAVAEFLLLCLLTLGVPALLAVDLLVIGHTTVSDNSVTELAQHVLLFAAAACFWIAAWRQPAARGFLVLAAGFLSCMFIRELDSFLDRITHGFWFYPAVLAAIGAMIYAARCRGTVLAPMADFTGTRAYPYLAFGMLVTLVFSRTFASGNLLWEPVMGADYSRLLKEAMQEGLELFGYLFIFWGSWLALRWTHRR